MELAAEVVIRVDRRNREFSPTTKVEINNH